MTREKNVKKKTSSSKSKKCSLEKNAESFIYWQ